MPVTHITAVRNGLADYITSQLDAAGADANADLVFMTSGDVVVATCSLSAPPSFGSSAIGVIIANAIADDTNAVGGTVALFKLQDRSNSEVLRGNVTATSGGGDIELSSVAVGAGDTVSMTSLDYTASL